MSVKSMALGLKRTYLDNESVSNKEQLGFAGGIFGNAMGQDSTETFADKFNRNYTLKKREGGLRFERITYGPDPEGLRYISAGINTLAIVLIFAAIAAALLWPERFNGDFFIPVVSVSMIMVISVVFAVTEMKLRKKIE